MRFNNLVILLVVLVFSTTSYAKSASSSMETNFPSANAADLNKGEGEKFLTANKTHPGVISLPDGMQYKELVKGTGTQPSDNDLVTVDYVGSFINGKEFDSSYKRGEPSSFRVNEVIPGWTEALKMMKTGSTWMLYIPSHLAYGETGFPPTIGPNQTLIFKVTLKDVKKT